MKKIIVLMLSAIMAAACFTACSGSNEEKTASGAKSTSATVISTESTTAETQAADEKNTNSDFNAVITNANVTSDGMIDASSLFTERDLTQNADTSGATTYTLSDNNNITITEKGVYIISGTASNSTIIVEAPDDAKVQIVLSGVNITNSSAPAVYVKSADKVFVTTAENTENTLTVSGTFTSDGDTNTDAVIFSKDDLVLNGLGTLTVNSSDNGITSKDDLKITGGTVNITSSSDAVEANDSIAIADGTVNIDSQKDGLHSENEDDDSVGYIYICGGTLNIEVASDGIQGTSVVQIDGGTVNISGSEGIEGTFVQINGGEINIDAADDGINGSNKSSKYTTTIEINGGNITINMGQGDTDGVDSNGNLYINGGVISINAQSPFDYDGQAQHNGGTIIVNGTETDQITNQMMGGGMGGPGGMGGMNPGDRMGGGFGG